MSWLEVLVEGSSDVPAVREVLIRKMQLEENLHFRIHPHKGRGTLPVNPLKRPDVWNQSLLHQLPKKLEGFGRSLGRDAWVLVVVDADDSNPDTLLAELNIMMEQLPKKPRVLFLLAIEETESWFIADHQAVKLAYPQAKTQGLQKLNADAVVGAWEKLAEALGYDLKVVKQEENAGYLKFQWAEKISPYLNLENPPSPSLRKLVDDVKRELSLAV